MVSFVHFFIFVSIPHIINMLRVFCPFHFHFIFNHSLTSAPYEHGAATSVGSISPRRASAYA